MTPGSPEATCPSSLSSTTKTWSHVYIQYRIKSQDPDHREMGWTVLPLKRKTDTREQALGAVITELRVKRGISYQDVAEKVGCNDSHMNQIEHGKKNPTLKLLQAIADFHHIRLSRMLALAEQKYKRRRR